jgi:hypothetical protein
MTPSGTEEECVHAPIRFGPSYRADTQELVQKQAGLNKRF